MRVAIVHDWLTTFAGAERVLASLLRSFPTADLFTMVDFLPQEARGFLTGHTIHTSPLQHWPGARRHYRQYLPLMPLLVEQFDLSGYDLIISSSHAVAKGVLTGPGQKHISYIHSPMRYAWDMQQQYLKQSGLERGLKSWLTRVLLHYLRSWDVRSSLGPDQMLANSRFVAERIRKCYRREAQVLYPPVAVEECPFSEQKEEYYVSVGRFVPYKRMDLLVAAFTKMPQKKLVLIGDGPAAKSLCRTLPDNIAHYANLDDKQKLQLVAKAKAFIFAAEEDFGIAPVEAMACGTPVLAYGKGGALETVLSPETNENPTGLFFHEQTVAALAEAISRFEQQEDCFKPAACRDWAQAFSESRFQRKLIELIGLKSL